MELDRLLARGLDDPWKQRTNPFDIEHSCSVVEQDPVDLCNSGDLGGLRGEMVIGVDRGLAEEHGSDDLGAVLLRDPAEATEIVETVEDIVDPVGANAVLVEAPHPEVHQRVRCHAERDRGVAAHPAPHRRPPDRAAKQVQAFPRILAAVLDQHLHERAGGSIDRAEAGAIEGAGHWKRHSRLHAHAPQALLPVAERRIEKLDVRHHPPPAGDEIAWQLAERVLEDLARRISRQLIDHEVASGALVPGD